MIDLLLAGLIVYGWPGTAFWVIGLFVAIELIVNGRCHHPLHARQQDREGREC
jgi:uncharacterized membrane protein HdeD (DUF308 family)